MQIWIWEKEVGHLIIVWPTRRKGEVMVFLNGKEYELANKTLATVLDDFKFDVRTIAVEINEEIISKTTFNETILKDGDVVEVVSFVGGG